MFKKILLSAILLGALTACSFTSVNPQTEIDSIAKNLDINYTVLSNNSAQEGADCKSLGAEWASCNAVNIKITNTGKAIEADDWTIYFHSIRMIKQIDNDQFTITHITGDLHKLMPTSKFDGFQAGEEVNIPITGEHWQLFETDFFPSAFITSPDTEPRQIASLSNIDDAGTYVTEIEESQMILASEDDNNIIATAKSRFEKNANVIMKKVNADIIPTPKKVRVRPSQIDLSVGLRIKTKGLDSAHLEAIKQRAQLLGLKTTGDYLVRIEVDQNEFSSNAVKGQYKLNLSSKGTIIKAVDQAGAFYAMQSMFSLVSLDNKIVPSVRIEDAPRFEYRGIMVDVARNFHSKEAILATIDQMAAYKLNKLHLHLSDDEGWRLAIPGLPELTDIGSKRCFDESEKTCLLPQLGSGADSNNFGSGHFSRADFIEILTYAKARSVDVIPEFDMPAHARAAVMSMEARYEHYAELGDMDAANEYLLMDPEDTSNVTTVNFYDKQSFINPCLDSSYHFVEKVITEVAAMYKEAGVPLDAWHFGGNEAKNIKKGSGYEDLAATEKVAWKGSIDLLDEDLPFAQSPICADLIETDVVKNTEELPGYFAEKIAMMASKKGITTVQAWGDGLKFSENSKAFSIQAIRANFWERLYWGGAESAYNWSAKGYDMIISNPDYLNMDAPYEVDSKERGEYRATRATDTRKMFTFAPENLPQNAETSVDRYGNRFKSSSSVKGSPFLGLSAQLWSATVRTDEQYEYMVFPRVIAAAERAWHKASWEVDYKAGVEYSQETNLVNKDALHLEWERFANIIGQRELAKLEKAGIDYRLPVPGAIVENSVLKMNSQFPGITLQYSVDNGSTWLNYSKPVKVMGDISIRSSSATGERTSRVTMVE